MPARGRSIEAAEPPATPADTDRAKDILLAHPDAGARGAIHVAVMLNSGVRHIASFDTGFDGLPGVERVAPDWRPNTGNENAAYGTCAKPPTA